MVSYCAVWIKNTHNIIERYTDPIILKEIIIIYLEIR